MTLASHEKTPHPLGPAIAAVPVKDEAERIEACLRALTSQAGLALDAIVLLINNTTDRTAQVVRGVAASTHIPIHAIEHRFPPELASAGSARRMGMERAASMLGATGILLTTDADGQVPPDWLARNAHYLRAGADAVAGRAVLNAADAAAIPRVLHEADARECAYAAALDELSASIDPQPWDPLPRHTEHSGASIAVTLEAYRRAGGMPAAPLAEDRRFFAALRRVDARIRHAPDIVVEVSGRIIGRAEGGMADTIRRRLSAPDPYLDSALEPAAAHVRRTIARQQFRQAFAGGPNSAAAGAALAQSLRIPPAVMAAACAAPFCGDGWATLASASDVLARRQVPTAAIHRELAEARRLLRQRHLPQQQTEATSYADRA